MSKDARILIGHVLDSINLIQGYARNLTKKDFQASHQAQDSIIRRLEIIGEAVRNLPDDLKDKHPEIPWRQIAGMRNVLIHEYFGVDLDLTWKTVERDLPTLKNQITKILNELPKKKKK
jgi:uncharacterized protein with HEPN domain